MEILRRFPLKYFAKVDFTEFCQYINPRSTKQKSNSTMLFKKTLYKNSMVLISNEKNGTVLLLDILAQLRRVRARITEETETAVTLQGKVGDLQNPESITFGKSSGPRTIDSSGVVENWILEEEEEEETVLEVEDFETVSVSTDATEPLEMEEGEESFFQYNAGEEIENQQGIEDASITARSTDIPEYDVSSWLESMNVTESSKTKKKTIDGRFKTPYLRRSRRLRNQRRNATTPWR
jgi:hypothetical protein